MAKRTAVWAIDIGQTALKALRCTPHDEPGRLHVEAFDYIEYPKILSQPEANPAELIAEALKQFLSRNDVRGDRVAISVAGQSGLARFIKLPPVESKKIPDIVKYEARQQIPFALEDVVWDYQQLAGGSVEEGFALETEVGLFAMKRDQVERALEPFRAAGIEVDIVQLTPLALYNFAAFDLLHDLPPPEEFDPDNPPESTVILSLGTDTTDLVITNGYRVWQRSVPIGGNHFTRALTKEMKLTFAKAEHLKRNAAQADDPKALFQAMRSVFSDLLTEVQRSIGYFTSLDRDAKIGRIVALGNTIKMPGLQRYLQQNLGHEVVRLDSYACLEGPDEVVAAPAFKDNLLCFATCYGLAVQALAEPRIRTNLLPRDIMRERLIREKKPWAVAAAAALLLGLTLTAFGHWRAWRSTHEELFGAAENQANRVQQASRGYISDFEEAKNRFRATDETGKMLVHSVEGRRLWLDLMTAINLCLPHDPDREDKPIPQRQELIITDFDNTEIGDVGAWFRQVQQDYVPVPVDEASGEQHAGEGEEPLAADADEMAADVAAQPGDGRGQRRRGDGTPPPGEAAVQPPSGKGIVFQLKGYHYHNLRDENEGAPFVHKTLIKNLSSQRVPLPNGEGDFPVGELGISHPVILQPISRIRDETIKQPRAEGDGADQDIKLRRFDFIVQFCWSEPQPAAQPVEADY